MDAYVYPPALSLPAWRSSPDPVDGSGRSFLLFSFGPPTPLGASVLNSWRTAAEQVGPTTATCFDEYAPSSAALIGRFLARAYTGVRLMVVGGQYDVLRTLALARSSGVIPREVRSFVLQTEDLPLYCAHCRGTHRVLAKPGDHVICPGCDRFLEVHPHMSEMRGSFLGSDSRARVLA